jgi:hypothetical protein
MDLASMTPHNELSSTTYCLANPESEFLVYFPEGDRAEIDLSRARGQFRAEWMHPEEGVVTPGGTATAGKRLTFATPFIGPSVLYLKKENA